MALPKRRHSKTRRSKRRTHDRLRRPSTIACSHCGQPKRPHRVCPHCGHYKGEEVLLVKES
ncbi:MAG: 50S ribosomal protein L32 [Candidatus Eisenbacteria bacterium]|nr:50S ribosomal protein L32 [Candidatus Eisenbacteria bacterium]